MKILLMTSPLDKPSGRFIRVYPPLGLAYLAAVLLEEGHLVKIYDVIIESIDFSLKQTIENIVISSQEENIRNILKDFSPDLVGISTLFVGDAPGAHNLAALSKKTLGNVPVVIGGSYPLYLPEHALEDKNIDFISIGDSEGEIVQFVDFLQGLTTCPPNFFSEESIDEIEPFRYHINDDLNILPFPARHLLKMDKYFRFMSEVETYKPLKNPATSILATRGCPLRCSFCTNSSFSGRNYVKRSVDNLKDEIEALIDKYDVKELIFTDQNMIHSRRYTLELTAMLKEFPDISWWMMAGTEVNSLSPEILYALRESGCYRLRFSMESGCSRTLEEMNKRIDLDKAYELIQLSTKLGFLTHGNFMLGMPNETIEDMRQTAYWAEMADFDYTTFGITIPYPNTDLLRNISESECLTVENSNIFDLANGKGVIISEYFSHDQLWSFRKEFWERINFANEQKSFRVKRYFNPNLST